MSSIPLTDDEGRENTRPGIKIQILQLQAAGILEPASTGHDLKATRYFPFDPTVICAGGFIFLIFQNFSFYYNFVYIHYTYKLYVLSIYITYD